MTPFEQWWKKRKEQGPFEEPGMKMAREIWEAAQKDILEKLKQDSSNPNQADPE